MNDLERHEMKLEARHSSGAEEWYCPTCGRRFVVQWSPVFNRVILEPGNQYAGHSGSTGGLRIGPPQITKTDGTENAEDEGLGSWGEWLDDVNFENF